MCVAVPCCRFRTKTSGGSSKNALSTGEGRPRVTGDSRPLLHSVRQMSFDRPSQRPRDIPRLSKPSAGETGRAPDASISRVAGSVRGRAGEVDRGQP